MNEYIRPDFSTPLTSTEGQEWILDPRYDFIRVFPRIGFGIINIITEEGVQRLFVSEAEARRVGEQSMIGVCEFDFITESDNEHYLDTQESKIEDWLD